jgi:DNA-binding MarR family transcriptional regulator
VDNLKIQELIKRYEAVSYTVHRKAEALIKDEISCDLTNDQQHMLRVISEVRECTSSELADIFDVKKSAITAIVNRLYDRGLINRRRDGNDRRIVYLSLTDEGISLFHQTEQKIHTLVESFITKFNEQEIESFIETYEKLADILIEMKNRK